MRNNLPAWVAIAIIALSSVLALVAYLIAPDNTPDANKMVLEWSSREPGFSCGVLLIPKSVPPQKSSVLDQWLAGTPTIWKEVPINGYTFTGEQIEVRHYIDDSIEDTITFPIDELVPQTYRSQSDAAQKEYVENNLIQHRYFLLGTDRYGRDILSRLLVGARVSIAVGFVAVLLSLTIGITLGLVAGYYGGWIDNVIMWIINLLWAIPTLLLVFAITLTIGKGFWQIFMAIGFTMWVGAARLIRGQVLVLRELDYVTAARALGFSDLRIMFRHILPNMTGSILVIAASNFAAAILIEAGLSFLGIGVQPPTPSWGLMIKEHYNFLLTDRPLLAIIPGVAIMVLVYAFNVLGNALRDALDVRQ